MCSRTALRPREFKTNASAFWGQHSAGNYLFKEKPGLFKARDFCPQSVVEVEDSPSGLHPCKEL